MEKEWIGQSEKLTGLLALERKPVAVTFTNEQVEAENPKGTWFCRALKLAAEGQTFVIDAGTSACPGGSWHCGLIEPPSGEARRAIQAFLTGGEKLTGTIVSFQRMQSLGSSPPTGLSDRILIGPMEEADMRPDIVVLLCDPEQACRLISLDQFWDGIPPLIDVSGSLCHSAISYPVMTGRTNLTLGDWTARRMQKFDKEIVFVTIPYERMHNLILAIPRSSAGTAEVEMPEPIRRVLQEEGFTEGL